MTTRRPRSASTFSPRRRKTGGASPRRRSTGGGGGWKWRWFKRLFVAGIAVFALLAVYFLWDMPDTDDVKPLEAKPSITVQAYDGKVIARYGGIKGDVVDVRDLPPHLVAAVLAIEDRRFYQHFGIDVIGLLRAAFVNATHGRFVQGGSTITQQLAKNLFLTPDKTIRRKVQEALLAISIDARFEKDDILSAYLNRVYFGSGAYGIDAAARVYFNKSATDLTLWESAVLAGVLKAPSRYSPAASPARSAERAKVVIAAMEDAGYLDAKKADVALKNTNIKVAGSEAGDLTRYFTDWIVDGLDDYIGATNRDIVVRTTFDPRLQVMAEKNLKDILTALEVKKKDSKDKKNKKDKTAKESASSVYGAGVPQAALVTLGEDGAVLALIGGRDYRESQYNRATQALRQPGSSFKPFVMLAALEHGATPDTLVEDAPITEGSYRPSNHDGKYYGTVTLTDALALSLNTATIRTLSTVGIAPMLDVLKRMPFHQTFPPELSIGLGASETTLMDLTSAYGVIANGGYSIEPYAVLEVRDDNGKVLYRHQRPNFPRVFASAQMAALDGMLEQVVARGTAQSAQLNRGHVAGKTGTSQNYRDAWFVGYTDNLVTGVWLGNDDGAAMARVAGGGSPARWWRAYMNGAIDVSLPSFVTTFGRPSAGLFGFGQGGPEDGNGIIWHDTGPSAQDQDAAAAAANDNAAPAQENSGFSSMLRYWSNATGNAVETPEIKPDNTPPQYNR